jgi:hypothetical protein
MFAGRGTALPGTNHPFQGTPSRPGMLSNRDETHAPRQDKRLPLAEQRLMTVWWSIGRFVEPPFTDLSVIDRVHPGEDFLTGSSVHLRCIPASGAVQTTRVYASNTGLRRDQERAAAYEQPHRQFVTGQCPAGDVPKRAGKAERVLLGRPSGWIEPAALSKQNGLPWSPRAIPKVQSVAGVVGGIGCCCSVVLVPLARVVCLSLASFGSKTSAFLRVANVARSGRTVFSSPFD